MNLRWLSASRFSSTALLLTAWLMSAAVIAADTPVTRALARVNLDDNAGALLILEEALEDFPGDQDTRFLYARVLAWNGQRTASLAQFEQLLTENPDNADYLLASARVLYCKAAMTNPCGSWSRRVPWRRSIWKSGICNCEYCRPGIRARTRPSS